MESQELNKLAEKYWKGACTDQEEQQLKGELLQGEVPGEMKDLAAYLRFQENERSMHTLGATFDKDILKQIESKSSQTSSAPLRGLGVNHSPLWYITRIAASLILILGLFWMLRDAKPETTVAAHTSEFIDTFENSEEAYREVKKALMMVSSNMNDGMKHTRMLGEFHKTQIGVRGQEAGGRNKKSGDRKNDPQSDI